jgi:tetratricopeptide (TPR) repeat protein
VDKSLVVPVDLDGQVRYRLLETVRQYAAEKLDNAGETRATHRRYLEHYLSLPFNDWPVRWVWDYGWLVELHRDHDNFRTALEWALAEGDADSAIRLVETLSIYWSWTEHPGAPSWFERALNLPGRPRHASTALALATLSAGWGAPPGFVAEAVALAEELGDPRLVAVVYSLASTIRTDGSDPVRSRHLLEESERLSQTTGFDVCRAHALMNRAWFVLAAGDYPNAVALLERALAVAPAGDPGPFATQMIGTLASPTLALSAALRGDVDRAMSLAENGVTAAHRLPLAGLLASALARAAASASISRRWTHAAAYLREQLALLRRLGTHRWVGETLEFAALTLEATGRPTKGARPLLAADHYRAALGEAPGGVIPAVVAQLAECRDRLQTSGELDPTSASAAAVPTLDQALLDTLRALNHEAG